MRIPSLVLIVLLLAGCSGSGSSVTAPENAPIREAAEEYFDANSKQNRFTTMSPPDSSFFVDMKKGAALVDIVRKNYGELETAILVVKREAMLDLSSMSDAQWDWAVRDLIKQRHNFIQEHLGTVTINEDRRTAVMTGYEILSAVKLNDGWQVFNAAPYFPDPETEADFKAAQERLRAEYRKKLSGREPEPETEEPASFGAAEQGVFAAEDTLVRKAAADFFEMTMKPRSSVVNAPGFPYELKQTYQPSVADIVYRKYGDQLFAIVVVRVGNYIDGSDMPREQWLAAMHEAREQGMPAFPPDSVVEADEDQYLSIMHRYLGFAAVKHESGWKLYKTTPYLPSAEAEADFRQEKQRIISAYNSRIR